MAAFSLFSLQQKSASDLSVDDRSDQLMADPSIGNSTVPAPTQAPYLPNQIVLGAVGVLALFTVTAMIYKEKRERGRQQIINSYQSIGQSIEEKREEQQWTKERTDVHYQGYNPASSSSLVGQLYAAPGTSETQGRFEGPGVSQKSNFKNGQEVPDETKPKVLDTIAEVHVEKRPDPPTYDEVLVHVEGDVKPPEEKLPKVEVHHEEGELIHVQDDPETQYVKPDLFAKAGERATSLEELENQDLKGLVGGNLVLQSQEDSSGEMLIQLEHQDADSHQKSENNLNEFSSSDV